MTDRVNLRVVVAGAVYDQGRLLAARRSAPPELAGGWELPGGKLEAGETPEQGLVRELREELGIEAEPVERVPGEWPLGPGHVLQVWTARLVSGEPQPLEDHDALRWLGADELDAVDWLPQDRPAVEAAVGRLPLEPAGRGDAPSPPRPSWPSGAAGPPDASAV
ncbi:(deoxy)nucleoside triphosphate pyrophosphohydrolase [Streptomyces sp. NPDC059176]|uniref:(deoxy)nucleoside triphosphate pyrophosphohydrolase n=1 Tax=unclassified Streptomyces TaxID=2593676 RepID=UPI0036A27EF7